MHENMLQNTASLPARIWSQVQDDILQLAKLAQQGQALAYSMSNIDDVFRERFSGYDTFRSQELNSQTFSQAYSYWSNTQRDTFASTLKTANLTADQITGDANLLHQLQDQSASADGQLKALQVGHSLAGLQADQIIKLRALIAQQTVMFGEVFGRRQAIEDRQQATDKKYFELGAAASIDNGKEY